MCKFPTEAATEYCKNNKAGQKSISSNSNKHEQEVRIALKVVARQSTERDALHLQSRKVLWVVSWTEIRMNDISRTPA